MHIILNIESTLYPFVIFEILVDGGLRGSVVLFVVVEVVERGVGLVGDGVGVEEGRDLISGGLSAFG